MMEIHEIDITDGLNKAMFEKLEKENKRLKEQLNEANEVIKWYAQPDTGSAKDYLKKWGVRVCK